MTDTEAFYKNEIDAKTTLVERQTYTLEEVCTLIGQRRDAVYNAVKRGEIPHRRLAGRTILFFKEPINRWMRGEE